MNGVATLNIPRWRREPSRDGAFQGDINFTGSISNAGYGDRGSPPRPTTHTLTSSPNPSTFGQTVTLTATVSPAGSTGNCYSWKARRRWVRLL